MIAAPAVISTAKLGTSVAPTLTFSVSAASDVESVEAALFGTSMLAALVRAPPSLSEPTSLSVASLFSALADSGISSLMSSGAGKEDGLDDLSGLVEIILEHFGVS